MDFEKQNKLPEGVGKKIIEALKTNKNYETGEVFHSSAQINNNPSESVSEFNVQRTDNHENQVFRHYQEPVYVDYPYNYGTKAQESHHAFVEYKEQHFNREDVDFSDIDTLTGLVSKLPPGVTKQTGAQIIRHTMEAMGIPMNKVLANAQMAQESYEQNIKNNTNQIEEYKSKIKFLEQEIQQYRKKAYDLEDVISLFILSENKR